MGVAVGTDPAVDGADVTTVVGVVDGVNETGAAEVVVSAGVEGISTGTAAATGSALRMISLAI